MESYRSLPEIPHAPHIRAAAVPNFAAKPLSPLANCPKFLLTPYAEGCCSSRRCDRENVIQVTRTAGGAWFSLVFGLSRPRDGVALAFRRRRPPQFGDGAPGLIVHGNRQPPEHHREDHRRGLLPSNLSRGLEQV